MDKTSQPYFGFEDLTVWQEATDWTQKIYEKTENFPKSERFGITDQIKRAAMSVVLNIAEGKGRFHQTEYLQFLYQARGSLYETVACLKMAVKLKYLTEQDLTLLLTQAHLIHRQLNALINYLRNQRGLK
jgi:four helix bundle protein